MNNEDSKNDQCILIVKPLGSYKGDTQEDSKFRSAYGLGLYEEAEITEESKKIKHDGSFSYLLMDLFTPKPLGAPIIATLYTDQEDLVFLVKKDIEHFDTDVKVVKAGNKINIDKQNNILGAVDNIETALYDMLKARDFEYTPEIQKFEEEVLKHSFTILLQLDESIVEDHPKFQELRD